MPLHMSFRAHGHSTCNMCVRTFARTNMRAHARAHTCRCIIDIVWADGSTAAPTITAETVDVGEWPADTAMEAEVSLDMQSDM